MDTSEKNKAAINGIIDINKAVGNAVARWGQNVYPDMVSKVDEVRALLGPKEEIFLRYFFVVKARAALVEDMKKAQGDNMPLPQTIDLARRLAVLCRTLYGCLNELAEFHANPPANVVAIMPEYWPRYSREWATYWNDTGKPAYETAIAAIKSIE